MPPWSRRSGGSHGVAGITRGTPRAGSHVVCCRATDAEGNTQPDEPEWNAGGYAHNGIQRVEVQVG